jgi:hypothetical protein
MGKRIKKSFSSLDKICPLWAKQSQSDAKCRNGYFSGKELYSYGYHYLLGKIIEVNGVKIAAINYKYYSHTTSGHSSSAYGSAENSGLLVLKFDSIKANYNTTDVEILAAVTVCLENELSILEDDLIDLTIKPSGYILSYIKNRIKKHNKACLVLGLKHLELVVPNEYLEYCKKIYNCILVAKRDRAKRSQDVFNFHFETNDRNKKPELTVRPSYLDSWNIGRTTI